MWASHAPGDRVPLRNSQYDPAERGEGVGGAGGWEAPGCPMSSVLQCWHWSCTRISSSVSVIAVQTLTAAGPGYAGLGAAGIDTRPTPARPRPSPGVDARRSQDAFYPEAQRLPPDCAPAMGAWCIVRPRRPPSWAGAITIQLRLHCGRITGSGWMSLPAARCSGGDHQIARFQELSPALAPDCWHPIPKREGPRSAWCHARQISLFL